MKHRFECALAEMILWFLPEVSAPCWSGTGRAAGAKANVPFEGRHKIVSRHAPRRQ